MSVIERFRPNIIVNGLSAYKEDDIIEAMIGDVSFRNPKPSSRCPIVTQEVETGKVVSKETLATLAEYRKKEGSSKVFFGVNLTPAKTGVIRIGDSLSF